MDGATDGVGGSGFRTTHWSLIVALPGGADEREAGRAREALEHLCGAYWRPLYAFARYSGHSADDARDLTQAFLTHIIETDGLGGARPDRGRFRSYLLGAMKHFMSNARARARAQKRGGGRRLVAGDLAAVESRIAAGGLAGGPTGGLEEAERAFDRDWARETTAGALRALEDEWAARGKSGEFEALRHLLTGAVDGGAVGAGVDADRAALAAGLGMTENALGVAVHRLRKRYAALVREAVARTVADEADVDDEMRHLIGVLRKN